MFRVQLLRAAFVFAVSLWLDPADPSNFSEFSKNLEDPGFLIEGADCLLRGKFSRLLASVSRR